MDFLSRDIRHTVLEAVIGYVLGLAICLIGMHNGSSEARWAGLAILGLEVYFLPSVIARIRRKRNTTPICLLNLFLGWTVLGWIGALIWAFMADEASNSTSQPRLRLLGVLAFLSVLFIIGTVREYPPTRSTSSTPPTEGAIPASSPLQTTQAQEPVLQTFSWTNGGTTYHGAMTSNVGVVVLGVKSGAYFIRNPYGTYGVPGPEDLIRADGKFITVSVGIYNRQNSAITMDSGLFKLVDSAGNEYSTSKESMEVRPSDRLFLAQINPGITKTGVIVFDVPETLALHGLLLRVRGGMTGRSADVALEVNSTVKQVPAPSESASPYKATEDHPTGPQ
jgi:hypothetical protein